MTILLDGSPTNAQTGERLIDVILRAGAELPHVCYHPQLGPIQTCDTWLVEIDGELVRLCDARFTGHAGAYHDTAGAVGPGGSVRPHSDQSPAVLHRLRQQQRQLHGS